MKFGCFGHLIKSGSLSGIRPGRGTNRNERLHKDINSHMKHNRYGVELAHALITTTLFAHNEHVRAKIENRCVSPINAFLPQVSDSSEVFGLCGPRNNDERVCDDNRPLHKVDMTNHELHDILSSMDISAFADTTLQELEVSPEDDHAILVQVTTSVDMH